MFQVGDKVVCVNAAGSLQLRGVYTVEQVLPPVMACKTHGIRLLEAKEIWIDERQGYRHTRFRKIQPCEPEFIELLKRIKPKVDA